MVYRRRKSFRRRKLRRRFGGRRGYKRMRKVIKKTVHNMAETKYMQVALQTPFSAFGNAWTESILGPSQGGLSTQIIARRYELVGFSLYGTLQGGQSNTVADDKYNIVRCMICIFDGDTQSYSPANRWPAVATTNITAPIRLKAPIVPADGQTQHIRRKVFDKIYTLSSSSRDSTGYMPALRAVGIRIRFKKPIIFNYCNESGMLKPDKYIGIGFISDSTAPPGCGFVNGALTWYWKDL